MTNYSLRARMMILILAPTVLIGLLLSIFFVAHRYNDLQRQLEDAGASIIEPLAVSSEYGMNLQNRESIGQLISVLHRRHFNKRALLIARKTKKSLYGLAERTGDGDRYPASLGRGNHGFNGSFATVGDRQFDVFRIGINFPKTLLYRGCNIQRTQALLV